MPFLIVLAIGILWFGFSLLKHLRQLSNETAELSSRLRRLEDDVSEVKQHLRSAGIKTEEPTTASSAEVILEKRSHPTVAPAPVEPVVARSYTPASPLPQAGPAATSTLPPELPPLLEPAPIQAPIRPAEPKPVLPEINWEQFMGVKLFAWIGGLALFLGVVFFVKYSFEKGWISPELRVAMGFLIGIGLLIGGVWLKRIKAYTVTSQTFCATGTLILYATTYACRSIYHFEFFGVVPTFLLMALITATAFLLAVRLEAQVVAILGMLGGFLTPVLLSTGVDNPLGLFGYIALLDAGLVAVALHRRWHYLVLLAAIGTVVTQLGWVSEFFEAEKIFTAMAVFLGFAVLFLSAFALGNRRQKFSLWLSAASIGVSAVSLLFVFYLLTLPQLGQRPPVVFSFVLGADLCLLALVLLEPKLHATHLATGSTVFLVLSVWTLGYLNAPLLNWGLGFYLLFAVLHSVFPLVLQRVRPGVAPVWWGHVFPPLALLLVMLPMFKFTELTWLLWPCVLLIDVLAIGLAVLTASLVAILAVLLLTVATTAVWMFRVPMVVGDLPEMLLVIGGFAVFFFIVGVFAGRKVLGSVSDALGAKPSSDPLMKMLGLELSPEQMSAQVPSLSAILPFLLLIMVVQKLALANPSPVFGVALLMVVLLLGMARAFELEALTAIGLVCTLALEHVWHVAQFKPDHAALPLVWYLGFYAVFLLFPFVFRQAFAGRTLAWTVAALAGPAHFYLVRDLVNYAWPNEYMGLIPAAFAVPSLLCLFLLIRQTPAESPKRLSLLAWFGGVALFFITLIFPIQFDRQWITLGWALEGAALLWLFQRVPHPGLRLTGVGLLVTAFVRLALNPAVLAYHPRSDTPILNWYLYAYGLVALCLFAGAWLLRGARREVMNVNVPPLLVGLGTVLAFLLLNIEIADYFTSAGARTLTFEFSGDFGRDMTYTIAWALFALALLIAGIWKQARFARYASLLLLSVTLLKLFFHDLAQLAQLYRIGALIGVAVIAILASFFYQRFFAQAKKEAGGPDSTTVATDVAP